MKNIVTVVGARPQFIKAAVISRLIRSDRYRRDVTEFLVHTGQHYDENMSDVFFKEMSIPSPDLNLVVGSGNHGSMTGSMLAQIEELLLARKPDLVLVYGDTNSTLAGALAASKLHIPVAHVEAGLRSFMMAMPEEQNRILTDRLSTHLFCPSDTAVENLGREGIPHQVPVCPTMDHKGVHQVGDIMLDASLYYRDAAALNESKRLSSLPGRFYLLTLHRAENTDDPDRLRSIVRAINQFATIPAVLPLHPRTRKALQSFDLSFGPHVHVIDPVGYLDMLGLEATCDFVVTDSGGVQKEAYYFNKPCITLRESTEWVELVTSGWNRLTGADENRIADAFSSVGTKGDDKPLYGNGTTGHMILEALLSPTT
jgi:UDP-GlcNAc3NAcA epimerase